MFTISFWNFSVVSNKNFVEIRREVSEMKHMDKYDLPIMRLFYALYSENA